MEVTGVQVQIDAGAAQVWKDDVDKIVDTFTGLVTDIGKKVINGTEEHDSIIDQLMNMTHQLVSAFTNLVNAIADVIRRIGQLIDYAIQKAGEIMEDVRGAIADLKNK